MPRLEKLAPPVIVRKPDSGDEMEERVAEFRERIISRPGLQYGPALRADLLNVVDDLRALGWSQNKIAAELGTTWSTLQSWRDTRPKQVIPVVVQSTHSLSLRSPAGWTVSGLSIEALKTLVS